MDIKRVVKYCRKMLLVAGILAGCIGCTNPMFVESQDVTHGAIEHFEIGMNKQQVLETARREGVNAIRPILPATPSVDYSILASLVSPGNGRSIELSYGRDQKVIFILGDCKVAGVRSIGGVNDLWAGFIGKSSEDLIASLKTILKDDHSLSAREVISSENEAWFSLGKAQHEALGSLDVYDVWSFGVSATKPAGSEFVIYFSEGSVVRISYKRPRIRVD